MFYGLAAARVIVMFLPAGVWPWLARIWAGAQDEWRAPRPSAISQELSAACAAVHDVSFAVPARRHPSRLIGPNGAGKTTIFNMIAGVFAPDSGTDHALTESMISRLAARPASAHAGIGRTFQIVKPFSRAHAFWTNVTVGALHRTNRTCGKRATARRAILEQLGSAPTARPARRQRSRCPTASGWRWRARSPPSPSCCCSTR